MKEKVPVQDEISKWKCQAAFIENDKNCQVNMKRAMCSDKQYQKMTCVHMCPVKPAKESHNMQSVTRSNNMKSTEPKILQSSNK